MAGTLTTVPKTPKTAGGGGRGADLFDGGFGDYGSGGDAAKRIETAKLGIWIALGSITMLFAAFTSAYIVRSAGEDWIPLAVPPLLWVNTAVILLSSVAMEMARRAFVAWRPVAFRKWLLATAVLGVSFLTGQLVAWGQLAEQGIYLQSHPHSSFFYVLTGVHAVHLLAGVLALGYVLALATRYELTPGESSSPSVCATYWHFVGAVWIYLMVVLFFV
jgi:cytochrome c oxidase subunit 3